MQLPDISWETRYIKKGHRTIAGADEVGRGAWAGPVVAASVVLATPDKLEIFYQKILTLGLPVNDSKQVKPQKRHQTALWLKQHVLAWGLGQPLPALINHLGILKATQMAFRQALLNAKASLPSRSLDFLLVDAFYIPYVKTLTRKNQKAIIKGDAQVLSIAAASIIAKDFRDSLMRHLYLRYPHYCWGRNKGYGTPAHQQAILTHGPTRHHRHLYISTWLSKYSESQRS